MRKKKPPSQRKGKPQEMPIPPDAVGDPDALELFRAWLVKSAPEGHGLQIAMNCGWSIPDCPPEAQWGMLLADLVQHVALHLYQEFGTDIAASVRAIRYNMLKELDQPTTEHRLEELKKGAK
jgi:hypothetical protein